MPGDNPALSAARFHISIDGHELGRFETLLAATLPGTQPRALQVHELPLLLRAAGQPKPGSVTPWEHSFEFRPGKFAPSDHAFQAPMLDPAQKPGIFDVTMKRGICSQVLLDRWQARGASSISLAGLSPAGQPVARYELRMAWPRKHSPAADLGSWAKATGPDTSFKKGGGDIAIEEIVIAHEGVRLD